MPAACMGSGNILCGWGGRLHCFKAATLGEPSKILALRSPFNGQVHTARLAGIVRDHDHSPKVTPPTQALSPNA